MRNHDENSNININFNWITNILVGRYISSDFPIPTPLWTCVTWIFWRMPESVFGYTCPANLMRYERGTTRSNVFISFTPRSFCFLCPFFPFLSFLLLFFPFFPLSFTVFPYFLLPFGHWRLKFQRFPCSFPRADGCDFNKCVYKNNWLLL